MPGRRGADGPPDEAYSRVTRDLHAVLGGLHRHADALVEQLVSRYDAEADDLTPHERARLVAWPQVGRTLAVRPADRRSATLLLGWTPHPAVVVLGGRFGSGTVAPSCACDACDTDLDDAVTEFEDAVTAVTGGFVERVRRTVGSVEVSHEHARGASSTVHHPGEPAYAALPATPRTITWASWPLRGPDGGR